MIQRHKYILSFTIFTLLLLFKAPVIAQKNIADTAMLDDVVITATRTERKLSNVAVPVSIINQKTIQQAGSLRLKDILQEQAGLFITNGFGAGVQMQGLNPDYTLILIDGEPIVGRTSGILDLNRITVGNIKKIEIVKGPSSSLYGSEALAGVINIITDKSFQKKLTVSTRYGSYNTADANVNASATFGKLGINTFFNYYYTNGYSIRPSTTQRILQPIQRFTPQVQLNYAFNAATKLNVSIRYNQELIKNELNISNNGLTTISNGRELNKEFNFNPTLVHQFSKKIQSTLRLYTTIFEGSQKLSTTAGIGYDDYFKQQLYKAENQTDITIHKNIFVTTGLGYIKEFVNSSRYDSKYSQKQNDVKYGFVQTEWRPYKSITFIGGLRYDNNAIYASAFSPKIAINVAVNKKITLQASYGKGFKAPDFRQLYLNFTNTSAGSYSVYGALEAANIITIQNQAGLVRQLENDYYKLQTLQPEFSNGLNAGITFKPTNTINWQINIFRNDIKNLIESRLVATRVDNTQIYSYINVKSAYTQGLETNVAIKVNPSITTTLGYQYLITADKDELDKINQQVYYVREANGNVRVMEKSDYLGLPNRSKHMVNAKVNYEPINKKWFVNIRAMYRSKWVVFDKDGNGVYNKQDEFAKGFLLVNSSAGIQCKNGFRFQAGVDNILNYIDANNLPNQAGISFFGTITYNIKSKSK
jgi:outer membrane receptor for ferrienterochelin and colicins